MRNHTKTASSLGIKSALSLSVGLSALIAGTSLNAVAQEDGETDTRRLATVTITATKREQTL